jgi:hypothetical protein
MMDIGIMCMRMNKPLVPVFMRVRRVGILTRCVLMLVMLIMEVSVRVCDWLMRVKVHVSLGEMQPETQRHKACCNDKDCRNSFGPN